MEADRETLQYGAGLPYARGCRVGDTIYLAGQDGKDFDAPTRVLEYDLVGQTERTFENIRRSLELFGAELRDMVKLTTYLVRPEDKWPYLDTRQAYLKRHGVEQPIPATLVWVTRLADDDVLVEVDVIAVRRPRE